MRKEEEEWMVEIKSEEKEKGKGKREMKYPHLCFLYVSASNGLVLRKYAEVDNSLLTRP